MRITDPIDYKILPWLSVPASDINFKENLKIANPRTIAKALQSKLLSKTARGLLERRFNALCIDTTAEHIANKLGQKKMKKSSGD